MVANSGGLSAYLHFKLTRLHISPLHSTVYGLQLSRKKRRAAVGVTPITCCCSDSVVPIRSVNKNEDRSSHRLLVQATPALPFASHQSRFVSKQEKFSPRCTARNSGPQSRDTPPKRDTGIANEKDWGINLLNENVNESGTNEDGSMWYRESREDLGENGAHLQLSLCLIGVEKSGRNAEGDSWWETWQEVLHQDEWSSLARIERSAQKQAKSGTENAGWYEKWWEKYDAKGWTEKGAHKYGRLNEQSWWEKWGEHYNGSVLKWTDKWAETDLGTKWGDKWEEKFFAGIGSRQGETWHVSSIGNRWSRTWGEEHFGNGKVHKYGRSTTGESWDIVVDDETYYEAQPHYGWADVVGDSTQLLSIKPQERPPGAYPNQDIGSSSPSSTDGDSSDLPPPPQ
ncbi:hypothetical protein GH714_007220 [Hevea brasiliensis]|uniref:Inactive purple acid phosphatase-like protein n=1 Tax=Hevea brasiliensis TaxID=3981 RepID=A0A6A6M945_HEVBR|nr:hypothetical protein GH714_007220 [Hevea brasiliensis]